MKKRVLFVIKDMYMGGSRKSLCSILNSLKDYNQYEICLLNMSSNGELVSEVPPEVNILKSSRLMKAMFSEKKDLSLFLLLIKISLKFLNRIGFKNRIRSLLVNQWNKSSNVHFDTIIGCQEGISNEVSLQLKGNKHIIWFHCDYNKYCSLVDESGKKRFYSKADKIIFVSEFSKMAFVKSFPMIQEKCMVIKNIIDKEEITNKAELNPDYVYSKNNLKIVSVGRLSSEKGFDRISEIVKRLKIKGISLEWFVIGGGSLLAELQKGIIDKGLEESVCFLGQMCNPYPIIKQADIYVMTSIFEAQPLVLIEALTLNIPVICTDFSSAREVVDESKGYGLIVENSVEGLISGIEQIICCNKLNTMKQSAKYFSYDNQTIIRQLTQLI